MEAWGREEVLRLKSGVQQGTGAQVPGEEGRAGKMRDREGMELGNEGVGRRVLGRRQQQQRLSLDTGETMGRWAEGDSRNRGTHIPVHTEK